VPSRGRGGQTLSSQTIKSTALAAECPMGTAVLVVGRDGAHHDDPGSS
jgi:hypothetical protein